MSVKQKMLIFEKPGDGWKSGTAEAEKDTPKGTKAAPAQSQGQKKDDLADILGALKVQMATVDKDYLKPTARGVCRTCKQNITGDMLACRSVVFHPNCFQCTGCKKRLNTDAFYYKDSESQYCEPCYLNKLTPICLSCEKPITGRHTYWNGAAYHTDCFTCSKCDAVINTQTFAIVNSAPFCLNCETGSAHDTRESVHRSGTCNDCGAAGEDNFCEKCGGIMKFGM